MRLPAPLRHRVDLLVAPRRHAGAYPPARWRGSRPRGRPPAWYGSLHLNTRYLTSAAARRKTAFHELGHIFGLDHRRTGRTCMRDGFTTMYGHPDGTDYANLRRIYARP